MPTVTLSLAECEENTLPPYCIVCGEATNEFGPIRRRFSVISPWFWFYCGIGWLVMGVFPRIHGVFILLLLIGGIVIRRRCVVWTPLCEVHRNYWSNRKWLPFIMAAAALGFIFSIELAPKTLDRGTVILGSLGLLIITSAVVIWISHESVSCRKINKDSIEIANTHSRFREELERQRADQSKISWSP